MKKVIHKVLERESVFLKLFDDNPTATFVFLYNSEQFQLIFFNTAATTSYKAQLGKDCCEFLDEDIVNGLHDCFTTGEKIIHYTTFDSNLCKLSFSKLSDTLVAMYAENNTEHELSRVKLDVSNLQFKSVKKEYFSLMNKLLTDREKEYLLFFSQGLTRKAISKQMNVSTGTIDTMKFRIKQKLDSDILTIATNFSTNSN